MQAKTAMFALLCTMAPAVAFSAPGADGVGVSVSLGMRSDTLNYTNIISGYPNDDVEKMKFDLDDMTELRLSGDWVVFSGLLLNAEFAHARADGGKGREYGYYASYPPPGHNRTIETYSTSVKLKGSTATRYSVGGGWRFTLNPVFAVAPVAGYAWTEQNIRIKHGWDDDDGLPVEGLNSRYKPRWHGPWLGAQVNVRGTDKLDFQVSAKHQWFKYRADANWNLRDDLRHPVSVRHSGDSRGWQLAAGVDWKFTPHHAVIAGMDWSRQRLSNGKDKTFHLDGTTETTKLSRLNADSWGAHIGYRFSF
jgi:opacity protein-like surface antigen